MLYLTKDRVERNLGLNMCDQNPKLVFIFRDTNNGDCL
jgi:hypothetical protein